MGTKRNAARQNASSASEAAANAGAPTTPWRHTAGRRGATVSVREVFDGGKGGTVYLFLTVGRQPRRQAVHVHRGWPEPLRLRDPRGRLIQERVTRAVESCELAAAQLLLGTDPFSPASVQLPNVASGTSMGGNDVRKTVRDAFDATFAGTIPRYPHDTQQRRDMLRASEEVLRILRRPDGTPWPLEDIDPGTARLVWRDFLKRARHVDHLRRAAERAVEILYAAMVWAHENFARDGFPPSPARLKEWKKALKVEWAARFDQRPTRFNERFRTEETRRIYERLDEADARVRLMMCIAPEQRAGQVIRATRRDLDLAHGAGELGLGLLRLSRHGRGKKEIFDIDLERIGRDEIDRALACGGYLSALEEAYRAGEIDDYHLWPAGKLTGGVKPVDAYLRLRRHMTQTSLIPLFRRYQRLIGVAVVPRRQFYGLRRLSADVAEKFESDPRALRRVHAWKNEEMRLRYLEKESRSVARKVATTRAKMMGGMARPQADSTGPGEHEDLWSYVAGLSDKELRELLRLGVARLAEER
jgi:hypothetical protein